jgi:hypothetical protein
MKNKSLLILSSLAALVILVGGGCANKTTKEQNIETKNTSGAIDLEQEAAEQSLVPTDLPFYLAADLKDVTKGEVIRGVTTSGQAAGLADATRQGDYTLKARIAGLPTPLGKDFYEGWVVRQEPLSVVSTGRLTKDGGYYVNNFTSPTDLMDHGKYILTLEPDDGDPAPADHIVAGDFVKAY